MRYPTTTTAPTGSVSTPFQINKQMLRGLAPLPDTAMQMLALLNDPDVSLQRVATLAVRDVGISASFLRMANSPLFGLRGRVGSVVDAIRVIGTASARLLVLASGVSRIAQKELPLYGLAAGAFGRHSELAANLTMTVAHSNGFINLGHAYTGGLLHDVGKVVLNAVAQQQARQRLPTIAGEMQARQCSLLEAERHLYGTDHTQIGRQLGELWQLPAELIDAITMHHEPLPEDGQRQLATYVLIANDLACRLDPEYPVANHAPQVPLPIWLDMERVKATASQSLGPGAARA